MYKSTDKDIIRHDDLVEEGAIRDYIQVEFDNWLKTIGVTEAAIKKFAENVNNYLTSMGGKLHTATVADIQKINKAVGDSNRLAIEDAKLKKIKIDLQKSELDLAKKQEDAKRREAKQTQELGEAYKKLLALRKEEFLISRELQSKKALGIQLSKDEQKELERSTLSQQKYDAQIKEINYSLGRAQENVGNYHNQLNTLGKSLKGFSALGDILARALGIDTELFTSIKEGGKALQDIKHVIEGVTLAKEGETVAHEANTAAVEVETVAINASTLGIGLLISGIIAAGAAIVTYIGHLKDQREEEDKIKQVEEQRMFIAIETLKMKAKNARDTLELYYKWEVLQGKMTEQEKESALAAYDTSQERGAALVKEQKLLTETAKAYKVFLDAQGNVIKNRDEITKIFTKREYDPETKKFIPYVDNNAVEKYFENIPKYEKEAAGIHDDYKRRMDEIDKESAITQGNITADHAAKEQKTDKETTKVHKEEEEKRTYVTKIEKQKREEPEKGIKTSSSNQSEADKKHYAYLDWLADNERFNESLRKFKENEEAITDALEENLQKRASLQQEYDQQGIDYHKRAYDLQAKLAAEGKDNVLASEQAALTKAEEKKIQDQKRALKAQQDIAVFKVFTDTLLKSLERDPNSTFGERLTKALGETAVVKSVFSMLLNGYKDGVENLDGPGNETSDSILARLSKGESVVNARGTKETPGLATAVNEEGFEGAKRWMKEHYDMSNSTASISSVSHHDYVLTETISKKFDELKKTIQDKPTSQTYIDNFGNVIKKVEERGIVTVTRIISNIGRPRL